MDTLGKYEIRRVLGRGAMGTVYEGWDPRIARRVAIKTVRLPDSSDSEERELLSRFQQEAQAAGRLQHPNIVGVFDYAETDELAYIVMEFVDGRTLKGVVDETGTPGLEEVGRLMDGLLEGLDYSHSNQVIHRDIKPANIIRTPGGGVKIADFGIARIGGSGMTLAGTIMGTPAYMSPEQFKGTDIDSRTDIYSAGVVLFQLLTGKRPFEGNMATIMQSVLNDPIPRASTLSEGVPPALDAVVARAMARAPDDRYQTAGEMNTALQAALRGTPAAEPDPLGGSGLDDLLGGDDATVIRGAAAPRPTPRAPEPAPQPPAAPPRRSPLPLVLAGVALLVLAGGGAAFFLLGKTPEQPRIAMNETRPAPVQPTPVQPTPVQPPPVPPIPAPQPAPEPVRPAPQPTPQPAPQPAPLPTPEPIRPAPQPTPTPRPAPLPAPQPAPQPQPVPQPVPQPAPQPIPAPLPPEPTRPAPQAAPAPQPVPVPQPTLLPQPTPEPVRPPAGIPIFAPTPQPEPPRPLQLAAIAAALRSTGCTAASLEERPRGTAVIQGAAGQGAAERALRSAVEAASPGTPIDWQVIAVDGPYCAVLDLVRPILRGPGIGVGLSLPGAKPVLEKGDLIISRATMPDWPSHLQLDYVSSDGSMLHMHQASPGPSYPANASPVFGQPVAPFKGWEVADPFGTDLVVGIASSTPLFRTPRPQIDSVDAYVRELRTTLEAATRAGARLTASVLVLRTADKR